ncbi:LegC family aminotransferase [Laribacter hongkongensis]|nr:LegC family aminotransferase [Laribacter hongkongensis]MCG9010313.1 LegC family aminotransferase [Laribacter hongkongensis]MCG9051748.1 LegC family aminotransferase [Laribacter hongkongensis]MCG9073779.1 LegC family aminotransferase [Laribacter hongkongensis]
MVESVLAALKSVAQAPGNSSGVPLHAPEFKGNEWAYVKQCLDSTFVSSVGQFVDRFEAGLAEYTGARHAIAVVNGTAALHVALLLAGVKPGDEVLVPALTFIATANAVSYCGAVPHFVDSEESTLGVDISKLRAHLQETTQQQDGMCVNRLSKRVIRALVPMHTFGHAGNLDLLVQLAADFNLALVEDAAESLGSLYRGRHTGTFGLIGTLSFNGNKTITTGGGGALLINDSELAKRAKHITTTARLAHGWEYRHDEVGFNYRLPNINAALGCAQLEQLPQLVQDKRALFERYSAALRDVSGLRLFREPAHCKSNYWLQTLILDTVHVGQRNALLAATNGAGIMTRPVWILMHRLTPYADSPRMDLACAEDLERRIINIPSSAVLGREPV